MPRRRLSRPVRLVDDLALKPCPARCGRDRQCPACHGSGEIVVRKVRYFDPRNNDILKGVSA